MLVLILIFLILLILGLIRPWYVLWYTEKKTRLMVLRNFGSILLALILIKILTGF